MLREFFKVEELLAIATAHLASGSQPGPLAIGETFVCSESPLSCSSTHCVQATSTSQHPPVQYLDWSTAHTHDPPPATQCCPARPPARRGSPNSSNPSSPSSFLGLQPIDSDLSQNRRRFRLLAAAHFDNGAQHVVHLNSITC